jgi:hypothetical protein
MNEIAGYKIEELPFANPVKVNDLLYADGPILSHYVDDMGKDILYYWIDFDNGLDRWLIWETNKKDLFDYLSGEISLFTYITIKTPAFVFKIDIDITGEPTGIFLVNNFALPEYYLPSENSYFKLGVPEFYRHLNTEWNYLSNLRDQAYTFNLKPTNSLHESTLSTRDAGQFLLGISKSIDSYIDHTATQKLKDSIVDRYKLNRTINQLKERLTPRVADTAFSSFQVSIAIDKVTLPTGNLELVEWSRNLIESYKDNVLDLDFNNEIDAQAIIDKFPDPISRKKIFEPIIKILENKSYNLSVSNAKKTFKKEYWKNRPGEKFKFKILPQQSIEELIEQQNSKTKIVTAIFRLPADGSISELKRKELAENLLFTEEVTQPSIAINPIVSHGLITALKLPLDCKVSTSDTGNIILLNAELDLFAEGSDFKELIQDISDQFYLLVAKRQENPNDLDSKYLLIDRLTGNNLRSDG